METNTTEKPQATPEATPAPVAGAATASETKPAPAVAQPPAESKEKPTGTEAPKGPTDFFKQREAKREKKAQERVTELERELAQLREKAAKVPEPEKQEPEPVFSLEDPEGSFRKMEERATQRALEAIERKQAEAQAQSVYIQAAQGAEKFLLTRSHLKEDPALEAEIAKAIETKYGHLADYNGGRDPMAAARLAYLDVCAAKGIVPDMDGMPKPSMNATGGKSSAGAPPSAPGTTGKIWNRKEAESYLMEGAKKPGELQARQSEIDQAKREGRIK